MTREEIIEAIQHDNMMPFLQDWEARDIVDFVLKNIQPSLPDGLEEAAVAYSKQVSDGHNYRDLTCGFKAGAEWQKEQMMDEWLKDRDGCFWDGVEEGKKAMKKQMLEDAIEIEVKEDAGGFPIIPLDAIELYDYENDKPLAKAGDKVKIIIVNEDKKDA